MSTLPRAPLVLLLAVLVSACGSTVQTTGTSAQGSTDPLGGTLATGDPALGTVTGAPPTTGPGGRTPVGTRAVEPSDVTGGDEPIGGSVAPIPGQATGTTISLGIPFIDAGESNAFVSSVGTGLATGDTKESMRLRIAELNARGGILGRKVVAVFHQVDPNSQPGQYEQAACSAFTQDHKVQYVVDMGMGAIFLSCMSKAGIGVVKIGSALMTRAGFARYPVFVQPDAIALDRLSVVQASRFLAMGFFGSLTTAKVGILYYDHPEFAAAEKVLEAELRKRGVVVAARRAIHYVASTADVGQTVSEAGSAVLPFRTAGVTHVLAVEENAWLTGGFGIAAASQEYYPRYGYTSQEPMGNIAANVPARALVGARFVGWNPVQDVADLGGLTAAGRACLRFFARAQPQETPNQRYTLLAACEALDFLRDALTAAGVSTGAQSLLAGAARLHSFASSVTFRVSVAANHRDGVIAARDGAWDSGCGCFRYTGPVTAL